MRLPWTALAGVVVLAAVAFGLPSADAGKAAPGGGGTIYVATATTSTPPQYALLAYGGLRTLSSSGNLGAALPATVEGVPSHGLHAGHRWFLSAGAVLVRDDGAATVSLLAVPASRATRDVAWGRDDSFVSYGAWDSGASNAPHRVFRVEVGFDGAGVPYATSEPAEVFVAPAHPSAVTAGHDWAPDGDRVVWASNVPYASTSDLKVTSFSSGVTTTLVTGPAANFRPSWSPDGTRIAFYGGVLVNGWIQDMGLAVVDATGANRVSLLEARDAPKSKGYYQFSGAPAWSPDGTTILFGACIVAWGGGGSVIQDAAQGGSTSGSKYPPGQTGTTVPVEVFTMSAAGGGLRSLTGDSTENLVPLAWR